MMTLNLGCGYDARPSCINVDKRLLPGVDVQHDLDVQPWPFPDEAAGEIIAQDVFEHLGDLIGVMNECWRILVVGGRLTIRGPLPDSPNLWVDVSHRRAFVENSFDHFDWETDFGKRYHYGIGPWRVVEARRDEAMNIIFDMMKLAQDAP